MKIKTIVYSAFAFTTVLTINSAFASTNLYVKV